MPAILFSPSFLNMLGFKVNSLDSSSVINLGPSFQFDLTTFTKANAGSGTQIGDFAFSPQGISAVSDPDVADAQQAKASVL